MRIKSYFIFLLASVLLSTSCEKSDNNKEPVNTYLLDSNIKYVFSEQNLEKALQVPEAENLINNGIKTYKIIYKTYFEEQEIRASGTLTIPDVSGEYPLALIQRGTIFSNSSAPSESILPSYEAFAGMGFVVFVPDLIGYGESSDILHPYFDYNYTATASIDMYSAVKEFIKEQNQVSLNDNFYISGYSQGGYSAMATFKYISENNSEIDVTAAGPGAGGYDIMAIVDNILEEDTYPSPTLLIMPIVTINELYTKEPLENIFNSPYDELIQQVIDGEKEWGEISGELPNVIKEIFNPELIDDLIAEEETFLTPYLRSNSVHDWAPAKPTLFTHHRLDEIMPIETTEATIEIMQDNGALYTSFREITDDMLPSNPQSIHSSSGVASLLLSMTYFKSME